jgi:hypothetical protein
MTGTRSNQLGYAPNLDFAVLIRTFVQLFLAGSLSILTKHFQPVLRKVHHKVKTLFSIRIA